MKSPEEIIKPVPLITAGKLGEVMAFFRRVLPRVAPPEIKRVIPFIPIKPAGGKFEERIFTSETGQRRYKLFIPSAYYGQAMPLVVMLHGCTQSPDDFAAGTRMNELAEAQNFLVAYPAQSRSANITKCWNWYNPGNQRREGGEPALIAGITRQVMQDFAVEPGAVFVAGLSAGGALAAVMAATYPELYAAVGVHSGLACGAASNLASATLAMRRGRPAARGDLPPNAALVPTIVFQGDQDTTVNPVNAEQVIRQAKAGEVLAPAVTEGKTVDGMTYTKTVLTDSHGRPELEEWMLHGAGHAWSGGSPAGSYTQAHGPDASREMLRFFMEHAKRPRGAR